MFLKKKIKIFFNKSYNCFNSKFLTRIPFFDKLRRFNLTQWGKMAKIYGLGRQKLPTTPEKALFASLPMKHTFLPQYNN